MATVVNFIDVTLRGAAARTVNLASAQILLTPSAPAFHVDVDGAVTPETITFTATLIDLDTPLTFNATGAPLTNPTAKSVTVAGASMTGSSVTVIASATVNGQLYTGPCTISKFKDGKDGLDGDGANLTAGDLKAILEGQITTDQLTAALTSRIGLIDGGADVTGSVTARVKAETDARIAAISQQAQDNRTYVQQYTYSQQTINDSFSAFGTNIQAAYQGYANGAADGALAAAKSFAQSYSYSKADADSSLTATANQLRSEFATLNQGTGATVAWVQEYAYSKAQANDAIASATQQLSTTVGGHTTTLETQSQSINGLSAQITTKIDNNGYVSGYGLASTPINGVPTSSFIVLADRFAVALPGQAAKYPFVIGTVNGQQVIGLRGDVVLDGTFTFRDAAGKPLLGIGIPLDKSLAAPDTLNSDIKVGGRNLYPDSSFERGQHSFALRNGVGALQLSSIVGTTGGAKALFMDGGAVDIYAYPGTNMALPAGRTYTISFDYKCATGGASLGSSCAILLKAADGTWLEHVPVQPAMTPDQVWRRFEKTFTFRADAALLEPRFGIATTGVYSWLAVDNLKIEEGTKATAWTPAIEDTDADVAKAGTTAQWPNVGGAGRPQDNATVGAPSGTMVGGTDAGLVASRALNGDSAYNAIPGINAQIDSRLRKDANNVLTGQIALQSQFAILVGDQNNGVWIGTQGLVLVQGGVVKTTLPISGDPTYAGKLVAAFGTFGALRIALGGFIAQGSFDGSWAWPAVGSAPGFLVHANGMLFGNRNDPNTGFFSVGANGAIEAPGLSYTGRQLRLDAPVIINPVLSPFNLGIVNSQNQYDYTLYRGSTDAYAGLYIATINTGNDGASFNWTVSGPWPCWLVQDANSTRMQLHINMKGGAPLAGDAGDFYINCSATKGGNTVNTQQLVTVTAS